jgi:hypothetical protein
MPLQHCDINADAEDIGLYEEEDGIPAEEELRTVITFFIGLFRWCDILNCIILN